MASMSTLVRKGTHQDCVAVALILRHELLRPGVQLGVFPVTLMLPLAENPWQTRSHAVLLAITQAIAETWLAILPLNPSALLDLPEIAQTTLAELLIWAVGSYADLNLRLSLAGLADDVEGRMLRRRLMRLPNRGQQSDPLSTSKILNWLSIRPPRLLYTYLIVRSRMANVDTRCQQQAVDILNWVGDLERSGVIIKLLMPTLTDILPVGIDTVALTWAPQRLEQMLRARIRLASNNIFGAFKDLFGPLSSMLPVDPDRLLVEQADGSLQAMLDLGNRVIREHIDRQLQGLEYNYLDQTDVDGILSRTTSPSGEQVTGHVVVLLDYEIRQFTAAQQASFVYQLARMIDIPRNQVFVLQIRSGSVEVELEMPQEGIERLVKLYMDGDPALRRLHIMRVEIRLTEAPISEPTIAIITALPHEYAAVKAMLENQKGETPPEPSIGWQYLLGEIPGANGGKHSLVLSLAGMGTNLAASCATFLLTQFPKIDIILMVGIAGGVPYPEKPDDHVRLGDIVVSNQYGVVQHDSLKQLSDKILYQNPPRPPSAKFLRYANLLAAAEIEEQRPWMNFVLRTLKRLKASRPPSTRDILVDTSDPSQVIPHPRDPKRKRGQPRIFLGAIASGNKLLKSARERDDLRDRFRVKAVEMEGSGIADAAWSLEKNYLVIRGICDYCDENKNDEWQMYAAIVAAAYARALIESIPA
jgi:nucleoside phosphorylase